MCIKHGQCESLLPKLLAVGTPRDEDDLFNILEDILELIIDNDDNIIVIEG